MTGPVGHAGCRVSLLVNNALGEQWGTRQTRLCPGGLALSSSPARQAPDAAPPEPTWLDLGPCAAGVRHLGSKCARSISDVPAWVVSRTESAALRELVFLKWASPAKRAKQ